MSRLKLSRAVVPVIENLESRQLMHAGHDGLHLNVNFQPASTAVPLDYVADTGATFANRGNGFTYGWNASNTTATRDRNKLADQRYDTFTHTQSFGARTWEAAVPNGDYMVRIVAGDPSYNDSNYQFNVEGQLTASGTPTINNRFIEGTRVVTVSDGKLTISNAPGAVNNKIAFVEIESVSASALSIVSMEATDTTAGEGGANPGYFLVTRTGSIAEPLTVIYSISGNAGNGSDIQQLFGSIVIPAGSASQAITIAPIDDAEMEPTENVTLALLAGDTYNVGTPNSGTVTIADNDSSPSPSVTRINFQPLTSAIPGGYLMDSGAIYGPRGGGMTYGWSSDNSSYARDRNNLLSADQRYDTFNHFNGKKWELAVAPGTYSVHIVAGDANYFDSNYRIDAEGVRVIDGIPTTTNRWIEGTALVTVTDGKLTINSGAGALNNKICFIDVIPADANTPILSVSAPPTNASENGPTARNFTITRTGSTASALQVFYTIGGTATGGGEDFNALGTTVTIPAGQSSVDIVVTPVDDPFTENTETVTLTLASTAAYAINVSSATIRINDNDTPVGNTITWTTKASSPIVRAEALRAVVDGKLYVFGGFSGDQGPVKRSDVFDPVANTWAQLPDLPKRITHAPVAVDGRNIYLAGGYVGKYATGYDQIFGTTEVWKFNTDTNQWTSVAALPKAVASGGLVVLGRELHYFSGNDSTRSDIGDHFVLNLDNPTGWTTSTPLPSGRSHLGFAALGGKIYAMGGQFGNDATLTTQKLLHVWDPANPSVWTRLADMPTAISHISSSTFVYGNRIVVAGGETAHGAATDLVYAYDPVSNTWAAMTKLPAKRFSGVAAELNGYIYFTTGSSMTTTWRGVVS